MSIDLQRELTTQEGKAANEIKALKPSWRSNRADRMTIQLWYDVAEGTGALLRQPSRTDRESVECGP